MKTGTMVAVGVGVVAVGAGLYFFFRKRNATAATGDVMTHSGYTRAPPEPAHTGAIVVPDHLRGIHLDVQARARMPGEH